MREGLKCWRTLNLTPKNKFVARFRTTNFTNHTNIFCKDFPATNHHKFPQTIFLLNLIESV